MPGSESSFIELLRSQLAEDALRGRRPDRETLFRRFPGHRAEVEALLAEIFANGRRQESAGPEGRRGAEVADAAAGGTPVSQAPAPGMETSDAAQAEGETPAADLVNPPSPVESGMTVLRTLRHGTLLRQPDGRLRCHLPADRLVARGPASLYLARAERLAHTAVAGVQTPEIVSRPDGSVDVIFPESPSTVVTLAATLPRRRGATHHALCIVRRAAVRLERLHAQGAAHGRLGAEHLRVDSRSGSMVLDTGLGDGPGRDGDADLATQKLADVRALGAILYGALELRGREPDVRDILARHEAGKLPYLISRRPRLLPAVEHLVERALSAGDWGHAGFGSINELLGSLEALLDMEGETAPVAPSPSSALRLRQRDWMPYAVIGGLLLLILVRVWLL